MADKRLLTSRRWHVDGKWFAPREFIEQNFASVVYCNYMEMSSSAGDWSGLVIQRLNRRLYAVIFSQENAYPRAGFNVTTQSYPIASVPDTRIDGAKAFFERVCHICFCEP